MLLQTTIQAETASIRPEEWVRRKFRVSPPVARAVAELAFATRIATIADRGIACLDREVRQ